MVEPGMNPALEGFVPGENRFRHRLQFFQLGVRITLAELAVADNGEAFAEQGSEFMELSGEGGFPPSP